MIWHPVDLSSLGDIIVFECHGENNFFSVRDNTIEPILCLFALHTCPESNRKWVYIFNVRRKCITRALMAFVKPRSVKRSFSYFSFFIWYCDWCWSFSWTCVHWISRFQRFRGFLMDYTEFKSLFKDFNRILKVFTKL